MHTDLECMSCFLQQALSTARLSTSDPEMHRLIVSETEKLLADIDMKLSPPENAVAVYKQIADLSGVGDPFLELKDKSNSFAMTMRTQVREQITLADDSLLAAVRFAIAGNIIDYGTQQKFDALQTLSRCMENDLCIDDYALLQKDICRAGGKKILYLADNCGEIVFDGLLIEQLQAHGHIVTLVVRENTILNDVTLREADLVGISKICTVITNGSSCPGTPLASCSSALKKAFGEADLIISKGQGNFETLSEVKAPIYFLLTVKCPVVASHISNRRVTANGALQGSGEMVLLKTEEENADTAD